VLPLPLSPPVLGLKAVAPAFSQSVRVEAIG
jgi:hypothetical protein